MEKSQEVEPISSYQIGYIARQQGISRNKNPLPSTGEMHKRWFSGWDHANEDLNGNNKKGILKFWPLKLLK